MTAGILPFYCVTTPKVGCTYLKNLFHFLEHQKVHHDPLRIHDKSEISVNREMIDAQSLAQGTSFFVVRDPVDRFFSFYFEKVYNTGPQSFPWIARRLTERRDYVGDQDIFLEQHRINCIALLGFLKYHFNKDTVEKTNAHWRPQIETAKKVAGFGLKPLLLEKLDTQLLQIADGRIVGLADAMAISARNTSDRLFTNAEILTPEIADRISALYASDQALYERVKSGWDQTGQPPKL
ncbi:MAG: sulfotransferase family 2 domain-containing protein [Alphaproteobacteria bacterium]